MRRETKGKEFALSFISTAVHNSTTQTQYVVHSSVHSSGRAFVEAQ